MEIYTVKEAAKILRIGPNKLRDMIKAGLIDPLIFGNRALRISSIELERFVLAAQGQNIAKVLRERGAR